MEHRSLAHSLARARARARTRRAWYPPDRKLRYSTGRRWTYARGYDESQARVVKRGLRDFTTVSTPSSLARVSPREIEAETPLYADTFPSRHNKKQNLPLLRRETVADQPLGLRKCRLTYRRVFVRRSAWSTDEKRELIFFWHINKLIKIS